MQKFDTKPGSNKLPPSIEQLVAETTVRYLARRNGTALIGSEEQFSRFQRNQREQLDLNLLEPHWQNIFRSFDNRWNDERQNYRYYYDTFKLFYYSFTQLRANKYRAIESAGINSRLEYYNQLAAVNLFGVYTNGKKCAYLVKDKLGLIDWIDEQEIDFLNKYSETRNKIFEHNFNPRRMKLQIYPNLWSLVETSSWLEIYIYTESGLEYEAKIDYYEDYYSLEDILAKVIMTF